MKFRKPNLKFDPKFLFNNDPDPPQQSHKNSSKTKRTVHSRSSNKANFHPRTKNNSSVEEKNVLARAHIKYGVLTVYRVAIIIPRQLTQIALWKGWSRSGGGCDCGVGSRLCNPRNDRNVTRCALYLHVDIDRDNMAHRLKKLIFRVDNDNKVIFFLL